MDAGSEEVAIRKRYVTFARHEAHGVSPLYEEFAHSVAENQSAIEFLLTFPAEKQQPNLLLAAVREHCGVARTGEEFCRLILKNQDQVRSTMLAKSTQTNEPARCATLLPVLSQISGPIALLEVGAAAGLCLYPDRYEYLFGSHRVPADVHSESAPTFACNASENTPLPEELPRIFWRAGIDLNPLDVSSKEDMDWLQTLVWPEQASRLVNLRRAIAIAQKNPPRLVRGELNESLLAVAEQAPSDATLVVFHTAVLAYVKDQEARDQFMNSVSELDAIWVSNEHPALFPRITAGLSGSLPKNQFLLAVDGNPVATTGPHGQSISWLRS